MSWRLCISVVFKPFFCWEILFSFPKESYPTGQHTEKSNSNLVIWDRMKWGEVYVGVQTPSGHVDGLASWVSKKH